MINHTFLHLPRIGETTEKNLWRSGVQTWNDFLRAEDVPGVGQQRKPLFDRELKHAQRALFTGDSSFFNVLPSNEEWRLWREFRDEAAFIDIETNHHKNITVLGISDGTEVWQFVRHHNMNAHKIRELLGQFKLLVSFNGKCFDMPIIERYFNDALPDVPHLDLRFAAAKAGLTGGLKHVEKEIGIARPDSVEGVSGADALTLWSQYRRTGNQEFRDVLLEYNAEDVVNLKPLADAVYERLAAKTKQFLKTVTA